MAVLFFALLFSLIAGESAAAQETTKGQISYATRIPGHLMAFSPGAIVMSVPTGLEAGDTTTVQILTSLESLLSAPPGIALTSLLSSIVGNRTRRS